MQGLEAAKPAQQADGEEAAGTAAEGEEDCSAEFKPLVQLDEVERVSGEEAEDMLLDLCVRGLPCAGRLDVQVSLRKHFARMRPAMSWSA